VIALRLALAMLLAGIGTVLPSPAHAAKKVIGADCDVGGCQCMLSSLTVQDVEVLTGEQAPAGAGDMTLVMAFGEMTWVAKTPGEIHRNFGGSGDCPIDPFPGPGADSGPRDGVWEITTDVVDLSQCPMAAMFGVDPPVTQRMTIIWDGRFDPNKYMPTNTHFIQWSRIDDANWRGTLGPVGGLIATTMRAQLVDRETIRGWGDVETSGLAREATKCMSLQSGYTARWVSDIAVDGAQP